MKKGIDDSCTLDPLIPTNHISKLTGPHDKVKNNTNTVRYLQNKQETKGSAEIKLPDREKDFPGIDHENIFKTNKIH